jgi:hypothetical protein
VEHPPQSHVRKQLDSRVRLAYTQKGTSNEKHFGHGGYTASGWEKGHRVQAMRSPPSGLIVLVTIGALISMFSISCSSPRSSRLSRAQVLGDIAVALGGYTLEAESGWHAEILATNVSASTVECALTSYLAEVPIGGMIAIATNLDVGSLPKDLLWIRREPGSNTPPALFWRMMRRYGAGQFFELPPGGHIRVLLPIQVPQAHPDDFVEHFVLGYRHSSTDPGTFESWVAEMRR